MTRHIEARLSSSEAIQALWGETSPSLESALEVHSTFLGKVGRIQDASVRFLKSRIEADLEAISGLAACKTPVEVLNLQMAYASDAMSAFADESRKLTDLYAGFTAPKR